MFSLVAYDDSEDEEDNGEAGKEVDEKETDSSSEAEEDDDSGDEEVRKEPESQPAALPSASLMLADSKKIIPGGVFSNPFREAEDAKIASLEKHVKMVDPEHKTGDQKRKICWSYRKGRCRFGSKCSFAHDSDLILKKELHGGENPEDTPEHVMAGGSSIELGNIRKQGNNQQNKKKRPGLARELVPPKKVLKMYHRDKFSSKP